MSGLKLSQSGSTQKLLPAGTYDAVVQAVIELGTQPRKFQGEEQKPSPQVKFVFEVPSIVNEETKETAVIGYKNVTASTNAKGNFAKLIKTLVGKNDPETIRDLTASRESLFKLVGKVVTITVEEYTPEGSEYSRSYIAEVSRFDTRLPAPTPQRQGIVFLTNDDSKENVEAFVTGLTKHTRNLVMSALDVADYSDQVKKAYAKIQEQETKENPIA